MARVLVNVPKQVAKGKPFDVKVLISHPMESGQRRDVDGQAIPRKIINRFTCSLGGEEVVSFDLFPAISANPFLAFSVTAEASGTLSMSWVDDDGTVQTQLASIEVA
jgi:sulfur-oxidizing protein SoxZ